MSKFQTNDLILSSDIMEIYYRLKKTLPNFYGKTILVTGAGGFLGRYIISLFQQCNLELIGEKISIIALDNHKTSSFLLKDDTRKTDPNIEWIYGDAKLGAELPNKMDYIIHAAGIASPEHYLASPLETLDVAVTATRYLLEKAKMDGARFLFFSSSEIYGDPVDEKVPTPEDYRGNVSARGPRACYDESKRLGETLCWIYQSYFDVKVHVVRPFNIFGPGMLPNDYRVIPNFANTVLNGSPFLVYGKGTQTRTFCYITDAIVAILRILGESENSDVFNIGNPEPEISMLDLANKFIQVGGFTNSQIKLIEYPSKYPKDDPSRRCPDISKLVSKLSFKPEVTLEQGLQRFIDWAKFYYQKS